MQEKCAKNTKSLHFYAMHSVIKKIFHVGLAFLIFHAFFLRFTRVLDTNMLVTKTRENARNIKKRE